MTTWTVWPAGDRPLCRCLFAGMLAGLCLLASGGCGTLTFGVSNSPDWCPEPRSTISCP